MEDIEQLATIAIDCGFKLHDALGPGLLESVYEAVLLDSLTQRGLAAERQVSVPIKFNGRTFDEGFRVDILIERKLVVELKSMERLAAVHGKQVLTYLRLMGLPLGLLMNFGAATYREGIKRIANDYYR